MPTHCGIFTSFSGWILTIDDENRLIVRSKNHPPGPGDRLRANGEFWLCRDDGLIGKFGTPDKIVFLYDDQEYNIWVETRGSSDGILQYGLIPVVPGGDYSNRFLAVDDPTGQLGVVHKWTREAEFRCVE